MTPDPSLSSRREAGGQQRTRSMPVAVGLLVGGLVYAVGHFAIRAHQARLTEFVVSDRGTITRDFSTAVPPEVAWPHALHALVALASLLAGVAVYLAARRQARLAAELRASLDELGRREQNYRALFERAVDGIVITDEDLHVLQANPSACSMLGYTRAELTSLAPERLLPPAARQLLRPADPGQDYIRTEMRVRRKDGTWIEIESGGSVLPDGRIQLILRDITARKAAETRLRESEGLLRIAGRMARVGGWIAPLAQDRVIWSDEVCAIHGLPPGYSPTLGDGVQFYAPEWRERIISLFGACAREGKPYDEELEIITAQGRRVWVRAIGEAVRDESGVIVRVQGAFQDVGERRRAREALQLSEARYRALVEHAPFGIYVNCEDRVSFVNQACLTLFGAHSADQLIGRPPLDLFDPAFHAQIRARVARMRESGEPVPTLEERIVRLDGRTVDVEVSAVPFLQDGVRANHVVLRDITERKLAEQERNRGHELLAKLARQVPGVIYQYLVDTNGQASFPYCSPAMRDLWEMEVDRLPLDATAVLDRIHPDDRAFVADEITASANSLDPFQCDFRVVLPRQGLRWRHSNATPERLADGSTLWHGIVYDVTERRHVEEALRASIEDKEALLREVHHRVKNNLQVITSLLRLQEARADTGGTREVLQEMQGRIRSMALLHESLHRSTNLARVDLAAYIESVCSQLVRATGHRGDERIAYDFWLEPVFIAADQAAPCGLIANELLSNALKHAFPGERRGRIQVSLRVMERGAGVRVEVADDGVGLPADFDARRAHSLGLQLVTDLCRQLDGSLEITLGPETRFAVTFNPRTPVHIRAA